MFKRIALAATAAMIAFTGTSHAADINGKRMDDGKVVIIISGKIDLIDGLKFIALTKKLTADDDVVVGLDSPGGAVIAGLTIGYAIHNKGWDTIVLGKSICASACADIWLAGNDRIYSGDAKIGMHSAGIKKTVGKGKNRKTVTVRTDNKDRIAYFVRLGLSKDAIVAMITPDPDDIMLLTKDNAKALGITYLGDGGKLADNGGCAAGQVMTKYSGGSVCLNG